MNKFLLFVFLLLTKVAVGQDQIKPISLTPPTTASLMKFTDIPVNYHTGVPEIGFPLYTVKDGSLSLPISLSYHASGMRVMEQASWVGAGWGLQVGGVVSRTIRGGPDERAASEKSYLGDKGYYNYLYDPNPANPALPILDFTRFSNGLKDGEPDLFFFNFNGYSGKFQFRPDTTVVIFPQQDIKIKPLFCTNLLPPNSCNTSTEYLFGFIITTPTGEKYYFGKTINNTTDVDPVERSASFNNPGGFTTLSQITSWYLYKIESPDGKDQITFNYALEKYSFFNVSTFAVPSSGYGNTNSSGMQLIQNNVEGVRLTDITFSNGKVYFDSNLDREDLAGYRTVASYSDALNSGATAAKALTAIRIEDGASCRKYAFTYEYFNCIDTPLQGSYGTPSAVFRNDYTINSDKKRLKLKSFQEMSCNGLTTVPVHSFQYYDETGVPRGLSLAQDHWGFYNGALMNDQLMPRMSTNGGQTYTEGYNIQREASWPQMRAGTLQRITYPTGGTSEFNYSYHRVYNPTEKVVGGLRIESIVVNPGDGGPSKTTSYSYNDVGSEQGVLYSRPIYISVARNDMMTSPGIAIGYAPNGEFIGFKANGCLPNGQNFYYFTSAGPIFPLTTSNGSHFGYRKVRVTNADGSYSVFEYASEGNVAGEVSQKIINAAVCDQSAPNYPPAPEPFNFTRGRLIRSTVYNSAGTLLKQSEITTTFTPETIGMTGLKVASYATSFTTYYPATEYAIKTSKKTKETSVELTFNPDNPTQAPTGMVIDTYYDSPNHTFPSKITTFDLASWDANTNIATRGNVLNEIRNTYVADVVLPTCNATQNFDQDYINQINAAFATYTATDKSTFSAQFSAWQTYMIAINDKRIVHRNARIDYYNGISSNGYACEIKAANYNAASTDLKAILDLKYKNRIGHILESSIWRNGKFLESIATTYQMFDANRNYIYPARYEKIQTAAPQLSTYFSGLSNSATAIAKDTKYVVEDNYLFKNGNIAEITSKDGVRTTYLWGYNLKYPVAKVIRAAQNQVYYQGFEDNGTAGDARTGSKYRNNGNYSIPFTPPPDGLNYKMTYWYFDNGQWVFSGEQNFNSTINIGTRLDEIRVYPKDAAMTTYTYELGKGISSITDANNQTQYYIYDDLGRLIEERDNEKNILKTYNYKYKLGTP